MEWSTELLAGAVPVQLGVVSGGSGGARLIEALLERCLAQEAATRRNSRRDSGRQKLRRAIGAIVGSALLRWLRERQGAVFQSHNTAAFTGELVGRSAYRIAETALEQLGLIEVSPSVSFPHRYGFGSFERKAARLRPTEALVAFASECGVTAATVRNEFRVEHPATAIAVKKHDRVEVRQLLRYRAKASRLRAGRLLDIEERPDFEMIRDEVGRMNDQVKRHEFVGCRPPSWARIFSASHLLNGRWQAKGQSYQVLPKADRSAILIDGEPVIELDIRASHLTIFAALAGQALPDGDPYSIPGVPREVVKQFVVVTLGNGRVPKKWPPKNITDRPELSSYPLQVIRGPILDRLPFLAKPMTRDIADRARLTGLAQLKGLPRLLTFRLMRIEAEAVTRTMMALLDLGILALPIHDSLIVPRSAAYAAADLLRESCGLTYGAVPEITGLPST